MPVPELDLWMRASGCVSSNTMLLLAEFLCSDKAQMPAHISLWERRLTRSTELFQPCLFCPFPAPPSWGWLGLSFWHKQEAGYRRQSSCEGTGGFVLRASNQVGNLEDSHRHVWDWVFPWWLISPSKWTVLSFYCTKPVSIHSSQLLGHYHTKQSTANSIFDWELSVGISTFTFFRLNYLEQLTSLPLWWVTLTYLKGSENDLVLWAQTLESDKPGQLSLSNLWAGTQFLHLQMGKISSTTDLCAKSIWCNTYGDHGI